MINKKAFKVLITIELVIAIVFYNIAKTWSKYSLDVLFFVICFTFANILEFIVTKHLHGDISSWMAYNNLQNKQNWTVLLRQTKHFSDYRLKETIRRVPLKCQENPVNVVVLPIKGDYL